MKKDNYLINITNNNIYISDYKKINNLDNNLIEIELINNIIKIKGENIKVLKMIQGEILLTGKIKLIEYVNYE